MATWDEIVKMVETHYEVSEKNSDAITFLMQYQPVTIKIAETDTGKLWLQILAAIGSLDIVHLYAALEMSFDEIQEQSIRGLIKIGDTHYIRHAALADDITAEKLFILCTDAVSQARSIAYQYIRR